MEDTNQSIGSDRLKKAIERNRRKQIKRPYSSPMSPPNPSPVNPSPIKPSPFIPNPATRPPPLSNTPPIPSSFSPSSTETMPSSSIPSQRIFPSATKKHTQGWFYKISIKIGWICCILLLGRLIFSERGMIDYHERKKIVRQRMGVLEQLKIKNKKISKEIRKIKTDVSFKKKLVRDRLGFIGKDEFLILFQKVLPDESKSN